MIENINVAFRKGIS